MRIYDIDLQHSLTSFCEQKNQNFFKRLHLEDLIHLMLTDKLLVKYSIKNFQFSVIPNNWCVFADLLKMMRLVGPRFVMQLVSQQFSSKLGRH